MARCLCGTDKMENIYCTTCGTQLLFDCEKCKKPVVIIEKFCGTCGTKNPHYDAKAFNRHPR